MPLMCVSLLVRHNALGIGRCSAIYWFHCAHYSTKLLKQTESYDTARIELRRRPICETVVSFGLDYWTPVLVA